MGGGEGGAHRAQNDIGHTLALGLGGVTSRVIGTPPKDLSLPVTLNGMTKDKMIEAARAREDTMFARGDFTGEIRRVEAAEKKLAPLAAKI